MEKNNTNNDPFAGMEEVASNWWKKGKIGDWIKGTLTDIRIQANSLKENEDQTIYEILSDSGMFHNINEDKTVSEKPTTVNKGEYWNVSGNKSVEAQMRNVKLGTIVAFMFKGEIPPNKRGNNPTKKIKVLTGGINPEYHGQDSGMSEAQ